MRVWWLMALILVTSTMAGTAAERGPLYYQDPGGAPFYSAQPKKAPNGREYIPVFEDPPAAAAHKTPAPDTSPQRRILYYRNPMGLPDTSPAPKKDSMGMDYLPVYADEDASGDAPGTVRINPGRIQTLGVRTETVAMRPALTRTIRATGNLQFLAAGSIYDGYVNGSSTYAATYADISGAAAAPGDLATPFTPATQANSIGGVPRMVRKRSVT